MAQRFLLTFGGTTIGRTWAEAGQSHRLPGYTVLTAKCTRALGKHVRAFVMVDNLLNRSYETVADYPMPGIQATGGITFQFEGEP